MNTRTLTITVQDYATARKNRVNAIKCIRTLNKSIDLKRGKELVDGLVDQNITVVVDAVNNHNPFKEEKDFKAREYEINSFVNELSRRGFNVDYKGKSGQNSGGVANPTLTGLLKEAAILAIQEDNFETAGEILQMLRGK